MYGKKSDIFPKICLIIFVLVLLIKVDAYILRKRIIRSVDSDKVFYNNRMGIPVVRTIKDVKEDDEILNILEINNHKDEITENEITESTLLAYVNYSDENFRTKEFLKINNIRKILKSGNERTKYTQDVNNKIYEIIKNRSKETNTTTDVVLDYIEKEEGIKSESERINMSAVVNVGFAPEEIVRNENEQNKSSIAKDVDIAMAKNVIVNSEGTKSVIDTESYDNGRRREEELFLNTPKPHKEGERPKGVCRVHLSAFKYYYEFIGYSPVMERSNEWKWWQRTWEEVVYPHMKREYKRCSYNKRFRCIKLTHTWFKHIKRVKRSFWHEACCKGYTEDKITPRDKLGRLVCVLKCDPMCVNGKCMEKNICQCKRGYEKSENNDHVCRPSCKTNCGGETRGECVAPNTCMCKKGHELQKNGIFSICVTQCPNIQCINSKCIGPSICKCLPGYVPQKNHSNICEPTCKYCNYGRCVAPEHCACNKGYYDYYGTCYPACNKHCGRNGKCVVNGTSHDCICDPGYKLDTRIQECVPHCENCTVTGICVAPNKCSCLPGHLPTKEGGCVYSCSFECGLGRCIRPDVCLCQKGYLFNRTAVGSKCVPFCRGCELGECISPNNCQCPRGYVYHVPKKGIEKTKKCIKTVKSYKYYDDKECRSIYDKIKRMKEQGKVIKERKREKLKWEEEKKRKNEYKKKVLREKNKKKVDQAKYEKYKAQRRADKTEWKKQQQKYYKEQLEKEKKEDEIIREMHAEYKRNFLKKSTVTWKNFARVALASLFIGPFGIMFCLTAGYMLNNCLTGCLVLVHIGLIILL